MENLKDKLFSYRKSQQSATWGVYNEWVKKVKGFVETRQATYDLYNDVTTQIAAARKDSTANHPLQFNSGHGSKGNTIAVVQTIANPDLATNSMLAYSHLGYVQIQNVVDLDVASMACGPEVEGGNNGVTIIDNRSFMGKIYDFVTMKPDEAASTVDNRTGHAVHFLPPKITEPKPVGESVCEQRQSLIPHPLGEPAAYTNTFTVPESAVSDEAKQGGLHPFSRLLLTEYIARDIRPSVVTADGTNQFDDWWQNYVEPQVLQAQKVLAKELRHRCHRHVL